MKKYTAADVIGSPELYNLSWRIGRGSVRWECTGSNRDQTKVRFARLTKDLHQITCYVVPNQAVHTDDEVVELINVD